MADYKTFTNSELEDELEKLKADYEVAQQAALENYKMMLELASHFGEVQDLLEKRTGKKRGETQ